MTLAFSDLISVDDVLIDIEASSKKHALEMLSSHIAARCDGAYADDIFEALTERERLGCTAAEFGIAVPHARLAELSSVGAVLMRLVEPIDFDSPEGDVDLLFCFVLPEQTSGDFDEALRALTRCIVSDNATRALREADGVKEVYAALVQVECDITDAVAATDSAESDD